MTMYSLLYHHCVKPKPSSLIHPIICIYGGISDSFGISKDEDLRLTGPAKEVSSAAEVLLFALALSANRDIDLEFELIGLLLLSVGIFTFASDDTVAISPLAVDVTLVKSILRIRNLIYLQC